MSNRTCQFIYKSFENFLIIKLAVGDFPIKEVAAKSVDLLLSLLLLLIISNGELCFSINNFQIYILAFNRF